MLVNYLHKITNLIFWQFRKKNFVNIANDETAYALNSLEKDSYFIYKNFLNSNEIKNIKTKLQIYRKTNKSSEMSSIYFRSRTPVSLDQDYIKIYTDSDIVKKVSQNFFNIPVEIEKCTYETKKGLKEQKDISEEDLQDFEEHLYHIDRGYGVLKFCLFLNDINIQNGPFCIIPGSHKWSANFRNFFYRLFHFFIEGRNDKISHSNIHKYFNKSDEKKLVGKVGDLLIVNTGAFHRASEMKVNFTREVFWIYSKAPNYLSLLKKKILKKNQ